MEFGYPGAANTQAWGINQAGDIVGWYGASPSATGFLRRHDGQFAQVAVPDATFTRPLGINEAGTIVGATGGPGSTHGFVLVQ
ncbi:MAG: hypothetical protein ACM3NQ_05855 [Bacteroidales bacterium]